MQRYIEVLRLIQQQSGIHVRQIVFPEWLVTALLTLVGLFVLSLIGYSIHKSDELKFVWKSTGLLLGTFFGVFAVGYVATSGLTISQRHAVMNVVDSMSTDDYVELQKLVQRYGKTYIGDGDLGKISSFLRSEFFPERTVHHYIPHSSR